MDVLLGTEGCSRVVVIVGAVSVLAAPDLAGEGLAAPE
jgi:hypothetical protein